MDPDDPQHNPQINGGATGVSGLNGNGLVSSTTELPFEDPPPKYTPPPSYTTATGARIAKMLRQSFRRSVRRIANVLGEGGSGPRQRPALQQQPPPPDYATVLVEMNQSSQIAEVYINKIIATSIKKTSNMRLIIFIFFDFSVSTYSTTEFQRSKHTFCTSTFKHDRSIKRLS